MEVLTKDIKFNVLISDLWNCCLTENICNKCKKKDCLIGYCKESLKECVMQDVTYVKEGMQNFPSSDLKLYDNHNLIDGISQILKQCRSCKEDHYDNCIINILRSAYEIILFGEPQDYNGSVLVYLDKIKAINLELSSKIFDTYINLKKS